MTFLHFIVANAYSIKAQDIGLDGPANLGTVFSDVVKLLTYLIGLLSTIFIIVGGLQMVSSAGDPQRFRMARETVIYSCVGIIIAIMAFAIVTFISNGV